MGRTWDYNTLIYCVHMSINYSCNAEYYESCPRPHGQDSHWLPSLPGARPAIPCVSHWPWKGVWLPVCLPIICDFLWQNLAYGTFCESHDCITAGTNDLWTYYRSNFRAIACFVFSYDAFYLDHFGNFISRNCGLNALLSTGTAFPNTTCIHTSIAHTTCALHSNQLISRSMRWDLSETTKDKKWGIEVSGKAKSA